MISYILYPLGSLGAGLIVLVAAIAIVQPFGKNGTEVDSAEASGIQIPQPAGVIVNLINLEVVDSAAIERHFPGRLEAHDSVNVAFEYEGRLESVSVREGETVRAGDTLARLRIDRLQLDREAVGATVASLTQQLRLAEQEEQRISRLVSSGAVAANQLDRLRAQRFALEAELSNARNALGQMDLRLEDAVLVSPVDGVVGSIMASQQEAVAAGQPVVSVFKDGLPRFRVGLPANLDIADLRDVTLLIDDATYPVTLVSMRPDVDPRSNTRTAIFSVDMDDGFSFGKSAVLTGNISLDLRGAWVPVDALRTSSEGSWIVLAVAEDMVARRLDVEVQHLRGSHAFVTGPFQNGTRIVGAGSHKVVAGQTVREN